MEQIYIPKVGEVFQMTLDGNDPANDPMAIIRKDGYSTGIYYIGEKITGIVTASFKLVSSNKVWVDSILEDIKRHGKIPGGQWRQAFMAKFPEWPMAYTTIGFLDCSWEKNDGNKLFPCLDENGKSCLGRLTSSADKSWLWLVGIR